MGPGDGNTYYENPYKSKSIKRIDFTTYHKLGGDLMVDFFTSHSQQEKAYNIPSLGNKKFIQVNVSRSKLATNDNVRLYLVSGASEIPLRLSHRNLVPDNFSDPMSVKVIINVGEIGTSGFSVSTINSLYLKYSD